MPTRRSPGCSATANEQTAITIAFRVPILEKYCGPDAGGVQNARISSSGASALRFTPLKNSATGIIRTPRSADSASTTASPASSGGWASPAGDAAPRLPPTVPRLRICGDPTVRDAWARPGSRPPSSSISRA